MQRMSHVQYLLLTSRRLTIELKTQTLGDTTSLLQTVDLKKECSHIAVVCKHQLGAVQELLA